MHKNFINLVISDKGLQWHQVSLRDMSKSLVVKEYGVGEIPALILIDIDGKILVQNISSDVLKSAIQKTSEKTDLPSNSL